MSYFNSDEFENSPSKLLFLVALVAAILEE